MARGCAKKANAYSGFNSLYNVPERRLLLLPLTSHALVFIPMTILGLIFLWREGFNAVKIQKLTEQKAADEPAPSVDNPA